MKTTAQGTPLKHPKSTGPENIGPERTDFGCIGMGAVGSLPATTLENNEKILPWERAENGLCGEFGGETGIRTLGGVAPTTVFETAPFDRSGISPRRAKP